MKLVSLLNLSPAAAQEQFATLLVDQCWARFAKWFVPEGYGATPPEADILGVVRPVLERCAAALPRPGSLKAVLLPQGERDAFSNFAREQMFGVSGLTAGAELIALRVGPETGWRQALADAAAHEYHHAAWVTLRPDIDRNADLPLAEVLAFEGRACVFARQMTDGWVAPWTLPIDDPEFEYRVRQTVLSGEPFQPSGAPLWWVYRMGTVWVKAALEQLPDRAVTDWTQLSARALFGWPVTEAGR